MTFEELFKDLQQRDKQDSERKIAPLKAAEDSYQLDTSGLTIDQVVERIASRAHSQATNFGFSL